MTKYILPIFIASLIASIALGQAAVTSTNLVIARSADTNIPPVVLQAYTNRFAQIVFGIGDRIDIGATETVKLTGGIRGAPSISILGVLMRGTNDITTTYSIAWAAGLAYTFVPKWNEQDGGVGVDVDVLRLPKSLATGQAAIPIAGVITPKLTVAKLFVAAEVDCDNVFSKPELRATGGVTLPIGPGIPQ